MGRDYRSHLHLSQKGRRTFKPDAIFFNLPAASSGALSSGNLPAWIAEWKPVRAGKSPSNQQSGAPF
jgi:hypothetical protein